MNPPRYIRPLFSSLLLSTSIALTACGSGTSPSSGSENPPDIQTRTEIGCSGVAGPLDALQTPLADLIVNGAAAAPDQVPTEVAAALGILIVDALDLVDEVANSAASLAPTSTVDVALLQPTLDQLLCTVAAAGEILLDLSLAATTPLADRIAINGALETIVALQLTIQTAISDLSEGGSVSLVANVLQQVTNTLGGILKSPLGIGGLPGGALIIGVLQPVSDLLLEVSGSMSALQSGDEQVFAQDLLASVDHLAENLDGLLAPTGISLAPVSSLLGLVTQNLGALLGGLLGIVL